MSFTYTTAFLFLSLPFLAVATPTSVPPPSQCNTGPVQCCNQVLDSKSAEAATLLGLLGIVLDGVTGVVGVTCNPITAIGVGANSCNANPVCCTNNAVGGLISIGCVPVDLGL